MKKRHRSLWLIGALALIWNGMGCMNFIQQMTAANLDSMPEQFRAMIAARPIWSTAAFGVAVFAGTAGAILLLLRNRLAKTAFGLSLAGTAIHAVSTVGFLSQFSAGMIVLTVIASLAVAVFLVWFARRVG